MYEIIMPKAEITDCAATTTFDLGRFDDHQARATGGKAAGVHQVPIDGKAVDAGILVHGRHHDAVLEPHLAQIDG